MKFLLVELLQVLFQLKHLLTTLPRYKIKFLPRCIVKQKHYEDLEVEIVIAQFIFALKELMKNNSPKNKKNELMKNNLIYMTPA